jgi:hypothetical protein
MFKKSLFLIHLITPVPKERLSLSRLCNAIFCLHSVSSREMVQMAATYTTPRMRVTEAAVRNVSSPAADIQRNLLCKCELHGNSFNIQIESTAMPKRKQFNPRFYSRPRNADSELSWPKNVTKNHIK